MDYNDTLQCIHSLSRFGSQNGLDRIKELMNELGNPQEKVKFIHIAGTNGKGTTAQMCCAALVNAGYTVGTFMSPFVYDFRERICVNGEQISKRDIVNYSNTIYTVANQLNNEGNIKITEFEFITAMAFLYFADKKCDFVCLEVGIGGRFDATNVIGTPEASVITSISMDHTQILGDTVEKIAAEKAEIIKQNGAAISYPIQQSSVLAVLRKKASSVGASFILPNMSYVRIIECNMGGSKFFYGDDIFVVRMVGEHNVYNALTVIETLRALRSKGYNIAEYNIRYGISIKPFEGRFQRISRKLPIYVDGAHNPGAMQALADIYDLDKKIKKISIIGMMQDKEHEASIKSIAKRSKAVITVASSCERAAKPQELADIAAKYCKQVSAETSMESAIEKAMKLCSENDIIVVCGSFYLPFDVNETVKRLRASRK